MQNLKRTRNLHKIRALRILPKKLRFSKKKMKIWNGITNPIVLTPADPEISRPGFLVTDRRGVQCRGGIVYSKSWISFFIIQWYGHLVIDIHIFVWQVLRSEKSLRSNHIVPVLNHIIAKIYNKVLVQYENCKNIFNLHYI